MRVVIISKALVVGEYQRKLEEIAARPGVELACIVPPSWQQDRREQALERVHTRGYELLVEPIRWNGQFHLFHFPGLRRRLAALRPDVVHVDEEPYNLATFLAMRDARRVGARSVFFTWQNLARRYPPPFSWFERSTFRSASSAIAGTADAGEVLRGKGYSGPISIIPQFGVDPDRFRPPAAPPDEGGPFVIGYLGRLVEEKGLMLLVEALAGLGQEWRVELYGHGPLRPALEARAAKLGLSKRVFVRPPVPSTEVSTLLGRMHVLALPSLTRPNWKEQFGRVLVEAMACGVPVIGSDSGEIPNVIGSAGLVFPEGSVAGLRDCLEELLVSAARRRELATLGRARVLERFTHQEIAAATVEVYRQMTT